MGNGAGAATVCEVAPGLYREQVNLSASLLTFRGATWYRRHHDGTAPASRSGAVVISGLDALPGISWGPVAGSRCVYRTAVPAELPRIEQLFVDGDMMVEARWPNLDVAGSAGNVGDAAMALGAWRVVGKNTTYGEIHDEGLAVSICGGHRQLARPPRSLLRSSPAPAPAQPPSPLLVRPAGVPIS